MQPWEEHVHLCAPIEITSLRRSIRVNTLRPVGALQRFGEKENGLNLACPSDK